MTVRSSDIILILVCILFPPAAVFFISGCSCDLLINICLTLLGYIPGHLHGFWLIYKKIRAEEMYPQGYKYLGNGDYEPLAGDYTTPSGPPAYGSIPPTH
ncbi:UPF0057-domain-containing protein [Atractiella rhizophila]|nr:UPF0057-domain-containing protein [Atractiella rhizophila]